MQNIIKMWNHCQKLHGFKSRWIHGKKKIQQRLLNKNMICGWGSDLDTDCWKLGRFHRRIIPYVPYFLHLLYALPATVWVVPLAETVLFGPGWYLQQPSWRVDIWPGQACLVVILLRWRFFQRQNHFYCYLFLCLCTWNVICNGACVDAAFLTHPLSHCFPQVEFDFWWKGSVTMCMKLEPLVSSKVIMNSIGASPVPTCYREGLGRGLLSMALLRGVHIDSPFHKQLSYI